MPYRNSNNPLPSSFRTAHNFNLLFQSKEINWRKTRNLILSHLTGLCKAKAAGALLPCNSSRGPLPLVTLMSDHTISLGQLSINSHLIFLSWIIVSVKDRWLALALIGIWGGCFFPIKVCGTGLKTFCIF